MKIILSSSYCSKMEASKDENLKIDTFNLDNARQLDQTVAQDIYHAIIHLFV